MAATATTTATRGRGRPRTFDEEAVLDALTSLFWQQGYESTSVADIAAVAKLNKSSLYNTFGSKAELFTRILERYIDTRVSILEELTAQTGDGIQAIHTFLEMIRTESETEMGRQGCLAVNTSAEFGGDSPEMIDFAERFRQKLAQTIRSIVARAATAGEVDPDQIDNHTSMLVLFMLGFSLAVRSGADNDELGRMVDAAHANVEAWRI